MGNQDGRSPGGRDERIYDPRTRRGYDLDRDRDDWRDNRGVDWRRDRDDRYDERMGGRGWSSAGDQFAERDRSAYARREIDRGYDRRFTTGYGYDDGSIGGEMGYEDEGYGQRGYGAQYGESGAQAGYRGQYPWQRRVRGPHAGKGPQGFQRSDERIRELVNEALTDHDEIDATNIEVRVDAGEVTLTGYVEDRRMKRLAEDCVDRVPGVRDVQNQLKVSGDRPERRYRTG